MANGLLSVTDDTRLAAAKRLLFSRSSLRFKFSSKSTTVYSLLSTPQAHRISTLHGRLHCDMTTNLKSVVTHCASSAPMDQHDQNQSTAKSLCCYSKLPLHRSTDTMSSSRCIFPRDQ